MSRETTADCSDGINCQHLFENWKHASNHSGSHSAHSKCACPWSRENPHWLSQLRSHRLTAVTAFAVSISVKQDPCQLPICKSSVDCNDGTCCQHLFNAGPTLAVILEGVWWLWCWHMLRVSPWNRVHVGHHSGGPPAIGRPASPRRGSAAPRRPPSRRPPPCWLPLCRLSPRDDTPGRVHPRMDEQLTLSLVVARCRSGHKIPWRLWPVGVYGVGRYWVGSWPEPTQVELKIVTMASTPLPIMSCSRGQEGNGAEGRGGVRPGQLGLGAGGSANVLHVAGLFISGRAHAYLQAQAVARLLLRAFAALSNTEKAAQVSTNEKSTGQHQLKEHRSAPMKRAQVSTNDMNITLGEENVTAGTWVYPCIMPYS